VRLLDSWQSGVCDMSRSKVPNQKWLQVEKDMSGQQCQRCGLRGEHECLLDIREVAENRKPDAEPASAKVRLDRSGK
jgi:hypothetical protein